MEKNGKETMENDKNEKTDHQEPEINYRGWKAMPFIIGDFGGTRFFIVFCFLHASVCVFFLGFVS